jgi:hypothetical protein
MRVTLNSMWINYRTFSWNIIPLEERATLFRGLEIPASKNTAMTTARILGLGQYYPHKIYGARVLVTDHRGVGITIFVYFNCRMRNNNVVSTNKELHVVFVMKMGRNRVFRFCVKKYIKSKERFLRVNYINMNVSRDQEEEPGSLPLATKSSQQRTREAKAKFSKTSFINIPCILFTKRLFAFNTYSHSHHESGDTVQSCPGGKLTRF